MATTSSESQRIHDLPIEVEAVHQSSHPVSTEMLRCSGRGSSSEPPSVGAILAVVQAQLLKRSKSEMRMTGVVDLFELFRPRLRAVLVVAVLVSLGTTSALFEPWIYRAIIDDIAGVFVAPEPLEYADRTLEDVSKSLQHLPGSLGRMFSAPLRKFTGAADERRELKSRTPQQAIATVLVGALLLVLVRVFSEWCGLRGDIRATTEANAIERGFILRTFRHVTKLPLSYFSPRASEAVARQVNQADQVAPLFSAVSKEVWPDVFSLR